jgi:Fic-DOC domain mobile mystery protein B
MGSVVSGLFDAGKDATPLEPAEREGLIPTHVTLRHELNELEQKNILEADRWAFARKRDVAQEEFLCSLHGRMFGNVWKWAGQYRTTERNLGVPLYKIQPDLVQFLDTVRYWIANSTFPNDEIAIRFHHGLVAIHPFPNGNGRWSRLSADILIVTLGDARFSWARGNLQAKSDVRGNYIAALKAADNHDFSPLLQFSRS